MHANMQAVNNKVKHLTSGCNCRKGCTGRCGCHRAGQEWGPECNCFNCANQKKKNSKMNVQQYI